MAANIKQEKNIKLESNIKLERRETPPGLVHLPVSCIHPFNVPSAGGNIRPCLKTELDKDSKPALKCTLGESACVPPGHIPAGDIQEEVDNHPSPRPNQLGSLKASSFSPSTLPGRKRRYDNAFDSSSQASPEISARWAETTIPSPRLMHNLMGGQRFISASQSEDRHRMSDSIGAQPLLDGEILQVYGAATTRLLLFDYDGTLTKIVCNPDDAILPPTVYRSIESLADEPKNSVWIISGRDQEFLTREFGKHSLMGLVAEHGAFVRYPRTVGWLNLTEEVDMSWKSMLDPTFQNAVRCYPGSRVEEKRAAIAWHYREVDPSIAAEAASVVKKRLVSNPAGKWPLEIIDGKCVIEARLNFVNKGAVVRRLLREFYSREMQYPGFVLCVGDDVTDEGKLTAPMLMHDYSTDPFRHVSNVQFHYRLCRSRNRLYGDCWRRQA